MMNREQFHIDDEPSRILVVDDEFGMREGCRVVLTSEGYEVETAEDGVAGLKIFMEKGKFSAALIDLNMPRMGGIELIEKMHELDKDLCVLVITAYATIETAVEATKRGAYGYIPKPFTPDELLLPVRSGLEKRALSLEAKRLREERENRLLEVAFERSKSNTIINCMTDGVLVINRDKQIVLRNAASVRIIPKCSQLPLPAPMADAFDCSDLSALIAETLEEKSKSMIISKEITLGNCTYMVNASPVMEPNGDTVGAVAVLRDITALKKLDTAKSMFVSMVAHEVRGPLAVIEGYLNAILSGIAGQNPERDRMMMERSLARAKTLGKMVSELMNLTAMETGHFTIKRSPLEIAKVVADAVEWCREKADEKGIKVTLNCAEFAFKEKILADKDAMMCVFTNLIDNAIKYTPQNGNVKVSVEYSGIYARVSVRDDGIGMTPEEQERAFDEFFRAKNVFTENVPGTGLGLSLVKRLVDMHHGKININSTPGVGSEFIVNLPTMEDTLLII